MIVVPEPSGRFDHDAHADRLLELGEQRLIDGVDVDLRVVSEFTSSLVHGDAGADRGEVDGAGHRIARGRGAVILVALMSFTGPFGPLTSAMIGPTWSGEEKGFDSSICALPMSGSRAHGETVHPASARSPRRMRSSSRCTATVK